jgi:hypothetical protein
MLAVLAVAAPVSGVARAAGGSTAAHGASAAPFADPYPVPRDAANPPHSRCGAGSGGGA